MRAAVNTPPPRCYSRRRASATLLEARYVFDHVPQRRLPSLAAELRARPAAVAARRPARRSAASAAAPTCGAASGTEIGSCSWFTPFFCMRLTLELPRLCTEDRLVFGQW